jgi:ribonuclease P protein component
MLRRIVKHAEYQSFTDADSSCRLPHFFVPVLFDEEDSFAFGITIGKKIGNAVARNRLRRRIKAWFFSKLQILPPGVKIILIAKTGAAELDWTDLCGELNQLIPKLKK